MLLAKNVLDTDCNQCVLCGAECESVRSCVVGVFSL